MKKDEVGNPLDPGLYFVSTPIGNARDITLRALDVLSGADILLAEDTRTLRRLMEIHGIHLKGRRILAYHDHNGEKMRPLVLSFLQEGRSVAFASDAGTPLVADPGFALGRAASDAGQRVIPIPGASAPLAALAISGLPTDRFLFAGFVPSSAGARNRFLNGLSSVDATLVMFESPRRLAATLNAARDILGPDRRAVVCRELTKRFEEAIKGDLGALAERFSDHSVKGEIVVCIDRSHPEPDEGQWREALVELLATKRLKDAATEVADQFGVSRRDVYQAGLEMKASD